MILVVGVDNLDTIFGPSRTWRSGAHATSGSWLVAKDKTVVVVADT